MPKHKLPQNDEGALQKLYEEQQEQQKTDKVVDFEELTKSMEKSGAVILPEDQEGYVSEPLSKEEHEKLSKDVEEGIDKASKKEAELPLTEEEKQKSWENFINQVKMYDVLEGLINRSLEQYRIDYLKVNPDEPISFALSTKSNRKLERGIIFDVSLVLTMTRGGRLYKVMEKRIKFKHVREVRNEGGWKFSLYQSILDSLVSQALTFYIIKEDAKSGRIKSEVPAGTDRTDS